MRIIIFTCLIFVGLAGWRIGSTLSSDALAMAVGVLFGVLAGLPISLLVMAAGRRSHDAPPPVQPDRGYSQPPPLIILLPGGSQQQFDAPAQPAQRRLPARRYADEKTIDCDWRR